MTSISQEILNWFFTISGALIGAVLKVIWDSLSELRHADEKLAEKVNAIEVLVAGDYVKSTRFDELAKALFAKLDKIEEKVDRKVDK